MNFCTFDSEHSDFNEQIGPGWPSDVNLSDVELSD